MHLFAQSCKLKHLAAPKPFAENHEHEEVMRGVVVEAVTPLVQLNQ
jgi:hypothetical protein